MFSSTPLSKDDAFRTDYTIVSDLAQHSGLFLTVDLAVIFLFRYFVLERYLIPRFYGQRYKNLNDNQRPGLVNHVLSLIIKILLLLWGAYPFFALMFTKAHFHDRGYGRLPITLGGSLIVVAQLFIAMYLHELCYRESLSYIAIAHHAGTIMVAQVAVSLTVSEKEWKLAGTEFLLCLVWGVFDVLFEGCPHFVIMLKRWSPDNHRKLRNWNRVACITTGFGTFAETVCVMTLFGLRWNVWSMTFKVLTPFLHLVFSAAQVWGTKNFYKMWREEERKMREGQGSKGEKKDLETGRVEGNDEISRLPG